MTPYSPHQTTIYISRQAIIHNLGQFKKRISPKVKLMAVVKANAYGHGLREVGRLVARNKADWLGVNSLEEALILRKERIRLPIFAPTFPLPPAQVIHQSRYRGFDTGYLSKGLPEHRPVQPEVQIFHMVVHYSDATGDQPLSGE